MTQLRRKCRYCCCFCISQLNSAENAGIAVTVSLTTQLCRKCRHCSCHCISHNSTLQKMQVFLMSLYLSRLSSAENAGTVDVTVPLTTCTVVQLRRKPLKVQVLMWVLLTSPTALIVVQSDGAVLVFFLWESVDSFPAQLLLGKEVREGFCSFFLFLLSFFSFFFSFLHFFIHSVFFLPASFSLLLLSFFFLFTDHFSCKVCEIYYSVSGCDCYYSGQYHIMHYAINY